MTYKELLFLLILVSPASGANEFYISLNAGFDNISLESTDKKGIADLGKKISVGIPFSQNWIVEVFSSESCVEVSHKTSEAREISESDRMILEFLSEIFDYAFGWGTLDLSHAYVYIKLKTEVENRGINALYKYNLTRAVSVHVNGGVTQWKSKYTAQITGAEEAVVEDSGVGGNIGAGFRINFGKYTALHLDYSRYYLDDISIESVYLGGAVRF